MSMILAGDNLAGSFKHRTQLQTLEVVGHVVSKPS